jgi:protein-S-isoprenylcysteine O-methyltransferase Ste14
MTKMNVIRQIISLILPITVLIIIPIRIESNWTIILSWNLILGLIMMLTGLVIMAVTISSFIRVGKGTLAPWSPTKKLVITGLYRYVRNPMILGVLTVLLGEATCIWSVVLLQWAAAFFVINMIYFIIYEEPVLENRFGEEYLNYKKHVSRWIPSLTPFDPDKK